MFHKATQDTSLIHRAARNHYDAFLQVCNRLEQYVLHGYLPDKVDIILMGGTFLAYPEEYQESFVADIYRALNAFSDQFYAAGKLALAHFKEVFELPCDINDQQRVERVQAKLLGLRKHYTHRSLSEEQIINETAKLRCIGFTIETKPDWGLQSHGEQM